MINCGWTYPIMGYVYIWFVYKKGIGKLDNSHSMPKILIVYDHPRFLKTLSFALEEDHEILTAESGREALDKIARDRLDLVMLDYFMPDLDGLEVLGRMRAWPNPPRVILMSARLDQEISQQARELGAVDCIEKPFDLPDLRWKIERALKK